MHKQIFAFIAAAFFALTSLADGANTVGIYVSDKGETLKATFDTRNNTVQVVLPTQQKIKLHGAMSASGARYTHGNREFWEHQGQATYSVGGKALFVGSKTN
jgi:membrane-bound inhibitor of C-type lysozyme